MLQTSSSCQLACESLCLCNLAGGLAVVAVG